MVEGVKRYWRALCFSNKVRVRLLKELTHRIPGESPEDLERIRKEMIDDLKVLYDRFK